MPGLERASATHEQLTGWTVPGAGNTYPTSLLPAGGDSSAPATRFTGVAGVALAFSAFAILVPSINLAVMTVAHALTGSQAPLPDFLERAQRFETVWGLLGAHLALASLTLIAVGLLRFLHRRRPRWLWSVSPGLRWRYLLLMLLVATVVMNAVLLLAGGIPRIAPQPGAVGWLVMIALTAPLQALGEEVFFRGYLVLALGLVWRNEAFAIVVSALLFAFFHGTQNLPLFAQRFAFGVLAGVLVWRTGGLEAGIAAHVANNVWAFTWAVLTSSVAEVRAVQELTWVSSLREVGAFALVTVVGLVVARWMRVPNRV